MLNVLSDKLCLMQDYTSMRLLQAGTIGEGMGYTSTSRYNWHTSMLLVVVVLVPVNCSIFIWDTRQILR